LLKSIASAPRTSNARLALLTEMRNLLDAAGGHSQQAGGLGAVRAQLIEATRRMELPAGASDAARDLLCLLPLMLLNGQRPRTPPQIRQAHAVLQVQVGDRRTP
jgi:hypothetical protein